MALIKCPDCGMDVSNQAVSCLNCGNPIRKPSNPGPRDVAIEIHQTYSNIIRKISGDLQASKNLEIGNYQETIRNLALANGAIAAFSLPLLSNPEILKSPLIFGVILLLTNIIISYVHLQRNWTKNFKSLNENERILLAPANEITHLATEVLRGNKNINDLIEKEKRFRETGGEYDHISEYLANTSADERKLHHTDDVIITVFILAIICLAWAIVGKPVTGFLSSDSLHRQVVVRLIAIMLFPSALL